MDRVLSDRISKLEHRMTFSLYLTEFPDELKLGSEENYSEWNMAFDMKLKICGLGIRDYLKTGDVGTFESSTSEQLEMLVNVMDGILTHMIYYSVKGFVLECAMCSRYEGCSLVLYIQSCFGSVRNPNPVNPVSDRILGAVSLGSDVFSGSGSPSIEETLSGFSDFKSQVIDTMSTNELYSVLLLISLSHILSSAQLKELVTFCFAKYGTDMAELTTPHPVFQP